MAAFKTQLKELADAIDGWLKRVDECPAPQLETLLKTEFAPGLSEKLGSFSGIDADTIQMVRAGHESLVRAEKRLRVETPPPVIVKGSVRYKEILAGVQDKFKRSMGADFFKKKSAEEVMDAIDHLKSVEPGHIAIGTSCVLCNKPITEGFGCRGEMGTVPCVRHAYHLECFSLISSYRNGQCFTCFTEDEL